MHLGAKAALVACLAVAAGTAWAQDADPHERPVLSGTVEVTTTRVPTDVDAVPASITVITGEELRARGITDLAGALSLVAGVSVAPGGDGGPASAVPELWGLREVDAFLLVVDGVPWGGAFNPALPALDLTDVERIEVLRGAAPVMYGATAFSGVIQVIHHAAGAGAGERRFAAASYGSGAVSFAAPLPDTRRLRHSLAASAERVGLADERAGFDRAHVLYRATAETGAGRLRLDVDGVVVDQDPASPSPRTGTVLSPLVPVDSNQNPRGSHIDENRLTLTTGLERPLAGGSWVTTLAFAHTDRDTGRGFLISVAEVDPNAMGYRQELALHDVYIDSHLALEPSHEVELVVGADLLYGNAGQRSEDFDYFASLDGSRTPDIGSLPPEGRLRLQNTRRFAGLYAQIQWRPAPRWAVQVGARVNHTRESLDVRSVELADGAGEAGHDTRTFTRGSGAAGVSWLAWAGATDALWAYADVRRSFKPAALDFGPDAESEILEPETSRSVEAGLKGRHGDGALEWELSTFRMDLANLVVTQLTEAGLPGLTNAGEQRFQGVEAAVDARVAPDLHVCATAAWHDAQFTDYERLFDGEPYRLDGNRPELSARILASAGLLWTPPGGPHGSLAVEHVGRRFLDMRNRAEAPAYTTWSAVLGYRLAHWDLRVEGRNLNDTRPPVAESEVGDAQYYRLAARTVMLSALRRF